MFVFSPDIDECAEGVVCNQICRNAEGSYLCSCHQGFTLGPDNQNCSPGKSVVMCVHVTKASLWTLITRTVLQDYLL